MKPGFSLLAGAGMIAFTLACSAADQPAGSLTNDLHKRSYGIGMDIGGNLKRNGVEFDVDVFAKAIKDVYSGAQLQMTEQEARQIIMAYQQELLAKRQQERQQMAEKNRAASEKFLAENKQKPDVRALTVNAADGSAAELQYKVLNAGEGSSPGAEDIVKFHYTAKTLDGKEIGNSLSRGQPMETVVRSYPIAGVREALQKMKAGAKWQLFIPPTLAFGDTGGPNVEPGSVIIYDVELVSFDAPQPLTSDIIKVPSKEELDKGAQIEVIPAAEAKRMQEQFQRTNSPAVR